MGLFRRKRDAPPLSDHAVITHLPLSGEEFGTEREREQVFALERRIEAEMTAIGGDHDGNEFGGGEAVLFTYGPDADALFDAIERSLEGFDVRPGAHAIKRYGPAEDENAREVRVPLGE